jgi:hypothetical protein
MIELVFAAVLAWPGTSMSTGLISAFGTPGWDAHEARRLQEAVLSRWPSPQTLMALWENAELAPPQRRAILLGGAEFHDPVLLPAYVDALQGRDPALRRAAHYGYRRLIGDVLPPPQADLAPDHLEALVAEIRAVQKGLRTGSLIDLWLESLLSVEGATTGRWHGVIMLRTPVQCLKSLDRLVYPEDFAELVAAFELSSDPSVRQSLMRLIEGTSLQRFVVRPSGENAGWGPKIYAEGMERLETKLAVFCPRDAETWIRDGFRALGVPGARPNSVGSCVVWRELIRHPYPPWGRMVAQQLHACGGPPVELSILSSRAGSEQKLVQRLDGWFPDDRRRGQRRSDP